MAALHGLSTGGEQDQHHTYNPALDKFRNGPSSRFDLDYPMAAPLVPAPGLARPSDANALDKKQ